MHKFKFKLGKFLYMCISFLSYLIPNLVQRLSGPETLTPCSYVMFFTEVIMLRHRCYSWQVSCPAGVMPSRCSSLGGHCHCKDAWGQREVFDGHQYCHRHHFTNQCWRQKYNRYWNEGRQKLNQFVLAKVPGDKIDGWRWSFSYLGRSVIVIVFQRCSGAKA